MAEERPLARSSPVLEDGNYPTKPISAADFDRAKP
jgi:hypothetical protein